MSHKNKCSCIRVMVTAIKNFLFAATFLLITTSSLANTAAPLAADTAFQISATANDYQTILVRWKIAPSYYLYQTHFDFKVLQPKNVSLGAPLYPSDTQQLKTSTGEFVVYQNTVIIPIPIINATQKNIVLQASYQGCSHNGFCYPPTTKLFSIDLSGHYLQWQSPLAVDIAPTLTNETAADPLFHKTFAITLLTFFGFGLLLSFTPCVLPMIPILFGIITGRKKLTHTHSFLLASSYVLGMGFLYAGIGVIFAMIGQNIQVIIQNPYVVIGMSLVLLLLALSLFDVFQLALPARLQTALTTLSTHQKTGSYVGAFIMGALSTLILSPCVTPALVAALGYISNTGNLWLGGSALFMMGLGSGVPLLAIGLLGPRILPKPGRWMSIIKYAMGIILIGIALTMTGRVLLPTTSEATLFQPIHSITQLKQVTNSGEKRPIMLDFYANWCTSCKEMDNTTFSNPTVIKKLQQYARYRVDLTANSAETAAIMQQYGVIAPPTIVFIQNGNEIPHSKIIGYKDPEQLLANLP